MTLTYQVEPKVDREETQAPLLHMHACAHTHTLPQSEYLFPAKRQCSFSTFSRTEAVLCVCYPL